VSKKVRRQERRDSAKDGLDVIIDRRHLVHPFYLVLVVGACEADSPLNGPGPVHQFVLPDELEGREGGVGEVLSEQEVFDPRRLF